MLVVDTYVGASEIEGVGVFASSPIKAGTLLWRFDPAFDHVFSKAMLDAYPENIRGFVMRYAYPHHELRDMWVLESDNGRFMNHSDSANTDFSPQIEAFALTDIAEGGEITCNYREFDPQFQLLPSLVAVHHLVTNGNGKAGQIHRPRVRRRPEIGAVLAKSL